MARTAALRVLGLVSALGLASAAQATVRVEGSAESLSVEVTDGDRAEVVAAIMQRLGVKTEGGKVEAGVITGSYSGTLSAVLRSILSANGFAIAYQGGKPIRVSFPYHGVASAAPSEAAPASMPEIGPAIADPVKSNGNGNAKPDGAPSMEGMLTQQLMQQMPEGQATPPPDSSNSVTDPKVLADMTKRAIEELREMEKMVNSVQPTP